ncbi:MAG: DUF475 domain-containing protein [Bdellovibrionaceae bacterium]|nr:DUF475 domain-containing protein [Pseudobdellovibrionaceae bacterium]
MSKTWKFFGSSIWVTVLGLFAACGVGYYYSNGDWKAAASATFIAAVLSVLEVSLSFDNAVVNAKVLNRMTPLWRHRFLTWGMLIAVFGMRLVFPLLIVGVVAHLNPWDALRLAASEPAEYARIMMSVHTEIAAFGGAFLLMVALKYFFDVGKEVHWINIIEQPLTRLGRMNAIELGLAMILIYVISLSLPAEDTRDFLVSGMMGLVTFIAVDGISALLDAPSEAVADAHRASAGMFLYLEVLDASFSFDGVVGAFAITHNLFIIAIGLGIGAMFVRSLTIMLVDMGTLAEFRYLEHGAFYAIGALAAMMFLGTFVHVSEVITGLIGAGFIALAFWSSIRHNRMEHSAELAKSAGQSPKAKTAQKH